MAGAIGNGSPQAGGHEAGFPLESPGEVALGVESQLFRHIGDAFSFLKEIRGCLDLQFQQVFVDADSCVFVKNTLYAGLADIAETGNLRNGGLAVDIAVQVADGLAEGNGIRGIRNGGDGAGFRQGQHQLLQVGGHHLGIGGGGQEWGQEGLSLLRRGHLRLPMDKGEHGGNNLRLAFRQPEDFFFQKGGQRSLCSKGKNQQIRSAGTVYDEFMKFQGPVKNDGSPGEVVYPFVAGGADLSFHHIETFPEIVGFSRKGVAAVIMQLKEGVHVRDSNLFSDGIGKPDHIVVLLLVICLCIVCLRP